LVTIWVEVVEERGWRKKIGRCKAKGRRDDDKGDGQRRMIQRGTGGRGATVGRGRRHGKGVSGGIGGGKAGGGGG